MLTSLFAPLSGPRASLSSAHAASLARPLFGEYSGDGWQFSGEQFTAALTITIFLTAVLGVAYVMLYRHYTPRPPVDVPEYLREPPADLPPAVVDALFTSAPTPAKMVATLLDLVRRDVIVMSKVHTVASATAGEDWQQRGDRALHLRRDRLSSLSTAEQDFAYELFDHIGGGADDVLLSTLRGWWHSHPATAAVVSGYWGLQVRREAEARGLLMPKNRGRTWLSLLGAVALLAPWWLGFLSPGQPGTGESRAVASFLTLLPAGVVMLMWAQRVTPLTDTGARLVAGYEALRRYLASFGRMQDKSPEAVVLWEQYQTLAVVLGLATETVDELYIMPPSFMEYGRAGRFGRRAYTFRQTTRFPDAAEAYQYALFRCAYDPTLPTAHVHHGDADSVVFRPGLGLARRSPLARHGVTGARRWAGIARLALPVVAAVAGFWILTIVIKGC